MGSDKVVKIKKSKKKKSSSSASSSSSSSSINADDHDNKKYRKKRNPKVMGLVILSFLVLLVLYSCSGSNSKQSPQLKKKQSTKKEPKVKDDSKKGDAEGGDGESLELKDVDFVESKYQNLGWTKTQGPLVVKRPPRECLVKRIAPQVTTPFFIIQKKNKWKRRIYTCLRHGKQACPGSIMDDFEARRWKLKPTKRPLNDRALSTFVLSDSLTLQKLKGSKPEVFNEIYSTNEGSTYLNALLGATGLDGSVLEQFNARSSFTKSFGCSYNALKVQLPQYRYDIYHECAKMEKSFLKHQDSMWALSSFEADGTLKDSFVKGTKSLQDSGSFCKENAKVTNPADSTKLASLVVQNPFKLVDKLFDVRSFILIGSTMPMMVFFQQGYVRQADGSMLSSPTMFDEDPTEISLEAFQEHLAKAKTTGSHYVDTFLQSSMKQIALFVFHAARNKITRRKGSYHLFSVDFVVDKTFRVYLEKTSGMPKLERSKRFDIASMVADMHDLVQELHEVPVAFEGMVKGDKYGKWELIFSELSETCHKIVYNPCHEFIDFNDKDLTKQNKKVGKVQATAKRLDNEAKRIVKKTEEKKKNTCKFKKIPYPSTKCNKLIESMDQEQFNKLFKEHEESFNPNEFRLPKPGEVFPHEIV